ncbi:hypothetical protein Hypma_005684 [Hypsizygus marmoreus]|uniref:Uncharacterized protein n=1 Tax=Hypsizygus marmoreus TaxID=39966 RepID=A0A369K1A9_HYPMA|nr:hypothetical protein Hypma_005684 [Hypsizygus marmoreus]
MECRKKGKPVVEHVHLVIGNATSEHEIRQQNVEVPFNMVKLRLLERLDLQRKVQTFMRKVPSIDLDDA